MTGYVDWLEQQGKQSAASVRASVTRHVIVPWPELADSKANSLTRRDLTRVVSRIVEANAGREAAKVRSYLRAAYAAALRADGDATIPAGLQGFNLESNPAADIAALTQFSKTRDTALTAPELRALWARLQLAGRVTGAALRLCLLLGGQRPTQLIRVRSEDIDLHSGTVTLFDPKGRRTQARAHVLPLTEQAKAELSPWLALNNGYVLSSTGGRVALREETLSNAFRGIADAMLEAGELAKPVRLADLRRTVETLLAGAGNHGGEVP